MMRLQKFLSQQGVCSRRETEELIAKKKILINGVLAQLGDQVDGSEEILLHGKKLKVREIKTKVLAWNKPVGVEVTFENLHGGKTLRAFDFGPDRVVPVGRLDKDSHGLLLLTNDGELCNFLAHPRYEHAKEYQVTVSKTLSSAVLERLRNGSIVLGNLPVKPCQVEQVGNMSFRIILEEGRNRQIRRMCEECALDVIDLLRTRVKNIPLGDLNPGEFRVLTTTEVDELRKSEL